MTDYMTFADIYGSVERHIKKFNTSAQTTLIKEIINQVYLNRVLVADDLYPLYWLVDFDDSLASVAQGTITAISKANPGVFTVVGHGHAVGNAVMVHNVSGMTEVNNRMYQIGTAPTADTLTLKDLNGNAIDTTNYTTYTSGGVLNHHGLTLANSSIPIERILGAKWHGYQESMKPIDHEGLEETTKYLSDSVSKPSRYRHVKKFALTGAETNFLIWYPGADAAYDLRYWAEKRVARMAGDTDTPNMPFKFHHAIVSGTIALLSEASDKVGVENVSLWPSIYQMDVGAMVAHNRKWWKEHTKENEKPPYML